MADEKFNPIIFICVPGIVFSSCRWGCFKLMRWWKTLPKIIFILLSIFQKSVATSWSSLPIAFSHSSGDLLSRLICWNNICTLIICTDNDALFLFRTRMWNRERYWQSEYFSSVVMVTRWISKTMTYCAYCHFEHFDFEVSCLEQVKEISNVKLEHFVTNYINYSFERILFEYTRKKPLSNSTEVYQNSFRNGLIKPSLCRKWCISSTHTCALGCSTFG